MVSGLDLQGGFAVAAARDIAVTALLSAFGTIVFRNLVAPEAFERVPQDCAEGLKRRLLWLAQASVAAGLLGSLAWLVVQASAMADAESIAEAFAAVPTVLLKTSFGHVIAGQLAAMLMLGLVLGLRDTILRQRTALGVATFAVALQAGHSHAASMYRGPSLLLGCDILHLLGAGAWLGGLLPLWLAVRDAPPNAGALAARRFSPVGQWCIAALVVSAAFQGFTLVTSIAGLVGTAYGLMVLVKLALFGVLLGFAAANRYRFAPDLLRDDPAAARQVLLRSIGVQTGFALAIVIAAVVLSELPPAMHLQPIWPFAERFSLVTINEDADFRREVIEAALALGAAVVLVLACLIARRLRVASVVAAGVIAWFAVPHFSLLLVEANPYSFYHSPTGFSTGSIVQGAALYQTHCAACHGAEGHGDGPLASTLPVPPADLTAGHLWMHSDGDLFHWLTDGIKAPRGGQAMPGFGQALSEDERWALIDYARAHNAGTMVQAMGDWMPPVAAPAFDTQCGAATEKLDGLRGRPVRLILGGTGTIGPQPGMTTILAAQATNIASIPGVCITYDPSVPQAYAIVGGTAAALPPGTQILIDGEGWLRAVQRPDGPGDWRDPKALAAAVAAMRAHPVAPKAPAPMSMNMPM